MRVAHLFMKSILSEQGAIYAPYTFEGNWSEEDKKIVSKIMGNHCPTKVDAGWNIWTLITYEADRYSAYRSTWDMGGLHAKSIDEFIEKLEDYHK